MCRVHSAPGVRLKTFQLVFVSRSSSPLITIDAVVKALVIFG